MKRVIDDNEARWQDEDAATEAEEEDEDEDEDNKTDEERLRRVILQNPQRSDRVIANMLDLRGPGSTKRVTAVRQALRAEEESRQAVLVEQERIAAAAAAATAKPPRRRSR
jgi:hypothetical protein